MYPILYKTVFYVILNYQTPKQGFVRGDFKNKIYFLLGCPCKKDASLLDIKKLHLLSYGTKISTSPQLWSKNYIFSAMVKKLHLLSYGPKISTYLHSRKYKKKFQLQNDNGIQSFLYML